jgi:hypothetical protein
MTRTRRKFLVGTGTAISVSLAGCGGGGDGGDGGESPTETTENQQTATTTPTQTAAENTEVAQRTIVDKEVDLAVQSYQNWKVYEDSRMRISYDFEVVSGPAIDVYVFTIDQYQNFDGARLFQSEASSESVSSGSDSIEVPSGTYHVVVDHSDRGETDPTGGVDQEGVTVQIQASVERL